MSPRNAKGPGGESRPQATTADEPLGKAMNPTKGTTLFMKGTRYEYNA